MTADSVTGIVGKVLIVEDDASAARLLEEQLRRLAVDIVGVCGTGDEAIETCALQHPAIVLMDISLDNGSYDGIVAADRIRVQFDIPVIFVTAHSDHATLERAAVSQPYGYLLKPVQCHELRKQLIIALSRYEVDLRRRESTNLLIEDFRSHADQERRQSMFALEFQKRLAFELTALNDIHEVARVVLDAVTSIAALSTCALYIIDEANGGLELVDIRGAPEDFIEQARRYDKDSPQMEVVMKGVPAWVTIVDDSDMTWETCRKAGHVSAAVLPILHDNRAVGCLSLASNRLARIPDALRALMESVGAMLGGVMLRLRTAEESRIEHERNRLLKLALDNTSDSIVIFDNEYRILFANPTFARNCGLDATAIQGTHITSVFEAIASMEQLPDMRQAILQDGQWVGLFAFKTADQIVRTFSLAMSRIQSDDGAQIGILGCGRDITEKLREDERQTETAIFAALGRMTSLLMHEIKTPLTSILMNADLLSTSDTGDAALRKSVMIIQKESIHLRDMLRRSLEQLSGRPRSLRTFDIAVTIQHVLRRIEESDPHHRTTIEVDVESSRYHGDEIQLGTAIENVCRNAIDAMEQGGRLRVSASVHEDDATYVIRVEDNGCGISSGMPIFRPFVTTKRGGTGIGLPLARNLVEQQGGRLELECSEPGNTVFRITLPLKHNGS